MRPGNDYLMPHNPNSRTEFLSSYCQTTAYPAHGGIVVGFFTAVELRHLGLSNLVPANRSTDPAEEDALALHMLHLGAHWWPTWWLYARHQLRIVDDLTPYDYHFPPRVSVAYPSSGVGVWVLKFSEDRRTWDEQDTRKPYLDRKPDGFDGKIHMALTMDERCDILREFGAVFYAAVEECEDIPASLEEGIRRGKRYEELLGRMDDLHYVERWLDGDLE